MVIDRLDYKNPAIKKLREEIKQNLRISRSPNPSDRFEPVVWYIYKIRKGDSFYKIMAMTGMDIDTISSANGLSSPMDIYTGMELKIPSSRGVFVAAGSRDEISAKYNIRPDLPFYDESRQMWFVPGARLDKQEKSFFYGFAFMRPLAGGKLSSRFGPRNDPFTSKLTFHGGVDIASSENSPVYASASGKIIFTGEKGGYGNLVIIQHQHGYETRYGHLNSILVKNGATVAKGDLIAKVGSTGRSTGFHLHFEVRRFSKRQRPVFHAYLTEKDLHKR